MEAGSCTAAHAPEVCNSHAGSPLNRHPLTLPLAPQQIRFQAMSDAIIGKIDEMGAFPA